MLELQKRSEELRVKAPHRYMHGVHNVNSSGDYVFDSKDTRHGFHVDGAENTKFCAYIIPPLKDSYDFTQYGDGAELTYEMLQSGEGVYNNHFGWCIWRQTKNSEYCMLQNGSSDCFGSIGLKNKRFCILNKQYSEDEYKTLRLKIIDDMNARPFIDRQKKEYRYGEFFPQDLCPFAYNETTAQEFFPLTKEEAVSKGYVWADKEKFKRKYTQTISASDLPDSIEETPDSILKEIIGCADCGAVYQIIPKELDFYRSNKLPLPRTCLECRYIERIMMRNPPRLWRRICQCAGIHSLNNVYQNTVAHTHGDAPCKTEFETSYAPDRPEIVYCEQCYQQEVV